jgi:predicted nuclease of restriction endonuclease-like (RecB) superfamily
VAKSKRARELRAEAALRRFQQNKEEEESETESEEEEQEEIVEFVLELGQSLMVVRSRKMRTKKRCDIWWRR